MGAGDLSLITEIPAARGRTETGDAVMTDGWVMLLQQQLLILFYGAMWGD